MAVENRYAVIRNGVDILITTNKKEADEYDKMLDVADGICSLLLTSELDIDAKLAEDMSIFLAKSKHALMQVLQQKKPKTSTSTPPKVAGAKAKCIDSTEASVIDANTVELESAC